MDQADRNAELAYDEAVMESAEDAHFEAWPEGCPDWCRSCARRMADRCDDSRGHVFAEDWTSGDTCYCGGSYITRREDGRIEVGPRPEAP